MTSSRGPGSFPAGFAWGVATSAFQIEGAVREDGRLPSIWDVFSDVLGNIANGDTADVATDHYHRFQEDIDLMVDVGVTAYRFSVAWPRIIPTGSGAVNQKGLDFYSRLLDGLLNARIRPFLTLYHWDLPQALQDQGGWTSRETASRFAEYAEVVARALGDRVDSWTTLNEPWCSAMYGYGNGSHAPGIKDLPSAFAASHHLLLAHGLAVTSLRETLPASTPVGITLNLAPMRSHNDSPEDIDAARRADGTMNRLFLDPLFRGEYPADVIADARSIVDWRFVQEGDLAVIGKPIDFLGINYYMPLTMSGDPRMAPEVEPWAGTTASFPRPAAGLPQTVIGWTIQPAALVEMFRRVAREYTEIPLYVTENGAAFDDRAQPDGSIDDGDRISYLDGHIGALADVLASGVEVRGYFVWTLMDNFEWSTGYSTRFGLASVQSGSLERRPKASARWYRAVIGANGIAPSTRPDARQLG